MSSDDAAPQIGDDAPQQQSSEGLDNEANDMRVLTGDQLANVKALSKDNVYARQSKWKTFRELPAGQRWAFFAQHFLLATVAVVAVVALVVSLIVTYATKPPKPYMSVEALGMNSYGKQLGSVNQGFLKHEGINDSRLLQLNNDMSINARAYEDDSPKVLVRISSGDINAIVSSRKQFPLLHKRGYASNLNDGLTSAQMSRLAAAGALVDAKGKPTESRVKALGLDLSKSSVWRGQAGLPQDCVLALSNLGGATKYVRDFVDYLDFV